MVRGPDWEWGSQDGEWATGWGGGGWAAAGSGSASTPRLSWLVGHCLPGGEGKPGRVVDIRGWDVETGRSVASVTWADGTTNVYRVGHKGKVDLKCVGEAAGGFYYREHLPRLGTRCHQDPTSCPLPWLSLGSGAGRGMGWAGPSLGQGRPPEPGSLPCPQASRRSCSAG